MKFLQSLCRTFKFVLLVLASWAAVVETALADRAEDTPPSGGFTDYTVAYFLVLMGIMVGLLLVLRSSNRREEEGPQQYVEKNVVKEE